MSRYLLLNAATGAFHALTKAHSDYSAKLEAKDEVRKNPDLKLLVVEVKCEVYAEREVRVEDNDYVDEFAFAPKPIVVETAEEVQS